MHIMYVSVKLKREMKEKDEKKTIWIRIHTLH